MPLMDSAAQELLEELAAGDPSLPPVTQRVMVRPFNLATATAMRDLNPAHIDTLVSARPQAAPAPAPSSEWLHASWRLLACSASTRPPRMARSMAPWPAPLPRPAPACPFQTHTHQ